LLSDIASQWPRAIRVKFLITCGAFVRFAWPTDMPPVGDNFLPSENSLRCFQTKAGEEVDKLLSVPLKKKLSSCTRYLTLGIDSPELSEASISKPHIELVCFVDLQKRNPHFTGKSYPTTEQERRLVRYPHLDSHFVTTKYGTVLLLVCHDITVFNPRAQKKAKGCRRHVSTELRKLAKRVKPAFVLHHPHTTVKAQTWKNVWSALHKQLPSASFSAGSVCYSRRDTGWKDSDSLDEVLAATKHGPTLDILVDMQDVK
jgi:hypothetical protein